MYFSAFPSASCAEHQCPLWEVHDPAGLVRSNGLSLFFYMSTLFLKSVLREETHPKQRPFSFGAPVHKAPRKALAGLQLLSGESVLQNLII